MISFLKQKSKKCGQKASNIYENEALGGRSSDGGERNPGGGVILLEAWGGHGPIYNIYIFIYIYIIYIYI